MSEPTTLLRRGRREADEADLRDALLSGGDSRLAVDPPSGVNKYLCPPDPAPGSAALSSCTASPISASGREAASARLRRVHEARSEAEGLDELRAEVEARLLGYLGAAGLADVLLTPSGTDAILLTASLLALEANGARLTAILPSATETGTGVPHAAACRGFDAGPLFGRPLLGGDIDSRHVALRTPSGAPREDGELCEAFAAAARTASGRPVVYLTHGSKTGLVAPLRPPAGAEVVVDACQMRLSRAAIRRCLRQGWPVVVTGSKFFAGPPFSGAVLVPSGRFGPVRAQAARAAGALPALGPLLRWTAALDGADSLPADEAAAHRLEALSSELAAAVAGLPGAEAVAGPSPEMLAAGGWPAGIVTFAVRGAAGRLLTADELKPLHRALAAAGALVGQPVGLGSFGGLRVAASAPDAVRGTMQEALDRFGRVWAEVVA